MHYATRQFVENLESRQILSASGLGTDLDDLLEARRPAAYVSALASKMTAPATTSGLDLVGKWKGTFSGYNQPDDLKCSMKIISHRGVAAIGDFSFELMQDGKKIRSTAIVAKDRSFKVMLNGKGFLGGLTGVAWADGSTIYGRWSCTVNGKWVNGMFTLKRK